MAHINVKNWDGSGSRPCDWCGKPLNDEKYLHPICATAERTFYIQLGYDGESDISLPVGYSTNFERRKQ